MATKQRPVPPRPAPRLYLATPLVAEPSSLVAVLPELLAAADVAAVLLTFAPADERSMTEHAKTIAGIVQKTGAALLLDGHFGLAARAGADGANISGIADLEDAISTLKPDRILGVGGLHTRHDAMIAGESGADYVLFGEPAEDGERPSSEAIFERLQWWAEVFEPPCVGYAATLQEAGLFAESGADFILVGEFIWQDERGPRAALIETSQIVQKHFDAAFGNAKAS
ncbi:MAG: thiamine phosphate synthase [Pseudomonadota bacterium]